MATEDTVLEEAMNNLKEAGQRIRATQSHGLGPSGDSSFFGSMATPSFAHSVAHLIWFRLR